VQASDPGGSIAPNGYGGFWATQTLPFGDLTASGSYLEFETALYASPEG
jgi:methyl acetate hydrolase